MPTLGICGTPYVPTLRRPVVAMPAGITSAPGAISCWYSVVVSSRDVLNE
jgi:hypothetical protein